MNQTVVVDASVAVKWVLDEEFTQQARHLLRDSVRLPILAPAHLTSEVTNALYQRVRTTDPTKHISAAEAQEASPSFYAFALRSELNPSYTSKRCALSRPIASPRSTTASISSWRS
jgi:predicted nucleic acid-binding protein